MQFFLAEVFCAVDVIFNKFQHQASIVSACLYQAAASIGVMVSAKGFSNYTAFWYVFLFWALIFDGVSILCSLRYLTISVLTQLFNCVDGASGVMEFWSCVP